MNIKTIMLGIGVLSVTVVNFACTEGCDSSEKEVIGEIQKETLQESNEENAAIAETGDRVKVHYEGSLEDGEKFDSSLERGEPFEFQLGAGAVISGWDKGLEGMKEGEKIRLVIPPEEAYGSRDVGPIPADSTLEFEVELLEVTKQD